jgi:hypothetical protein
VSDFDRALTDATMCNIDSDAVRCLFKRGDTFAFNSQVQFRDGGPSMVGAYGSGAKPIVNMTAIEGLAPHNDGPDLRIVDLDARGPGDNSDFITHLSSQVVQLLVLRVDMQDFDYSVQLYAGDSYVAGTNMHDQIAIVDSTSLSDGTGGFDLFIGVERMLFLGNNFGDKGGPQHVLRFNYLHGGAVSHNSLGRSCGPTQTIIKLHNAHHDDLGVWGGNCSREFIIADNLIDGCQENRIAAHIGPNPGKAEQCVEHFVVERNHFRVHPTADYAVYRLLAVEGHGAVVRNNIFDLTGSTQTGPIGVLVREGTTGNTSPPDDNRVYNNVCYTSNSLTNGNCIRVESPAADTIVKNNMMWAPNASSGFDFIEDTGTNTSYCDSGTDCNHRFTENPFVSSSPSTIDDYELNASASDAIDKGELVPAAPINFMQTTVPVDGDAQGGASWDLGALEYAAGGGNPPPALPEAPVLLEP